MSRDSSLISLVACCLVAGGCGDDVAQTGQVVVDYDKMIDFSQFETFSVVTEQVAEDATNVDLPEPGEDEVFFNDLVNDLIIEAMTAPPVCMEFIPPEEAVDRPPQLWVANGLGRTEGEGTVWQCQGGWWWGWWGWYWDPCAWVVPVPVTFDVGNLFIPVGPAPVEGEDPEAIFAGLAQSVLGSGPDLESKVQTAVDAIFEQWPVQRTTCD